jgi:hypothetical protein
MYDFVFDYRLCSRLFKSFLCIVCESLLVQLTFVEVNDKKESKLFSLASCSLYELYLFHFKVSNKLKRLISEKAVNFISKSIRFELYIKIKPIVGPGIETKIIYLLYIF